MKKLKAQGRKFIEAAQKSGCDESEAVFAMQLNRVAKAKPKPKPKKVKK